MSAASVSAVCAASALAGGLLMWVFLKAQGLIDGWRPDATVEINGVSVSVRPGETLTVLSSGAGRAGDKGAQETAGAEDVQPAPGLRIDTSDPFGRSIGYFSAAFRVQHDCLTGLQSNRQLNRFECAGNKRTDLEGPSASARKPAGRSEADGLKLDWHEPEIHDTDADAPVGNPSHSLRKCRHPSEHSVRSLKNRGAGLPHDGDLQPHAVPVETPPGVDDAERRAKQRDPQRHGFHAPHASGSSVLPRSQHIAAPPLADRLTDAHADACAGLIDGDRWDALMAEVQALEDFAARLEPADGLTTVELPVIQHGNADVRSEHAYLHPMTPAEEAREANLRG